MEPYLNPFDKRRSDLVPRDLEKLRAVTEGWYVEYKSEIQNASSIAKSVSAFANTYGGWLLYGVSQQGDYGPADSFPGIPTQDLSGALSRIRDAVSSRVTPTPHFDVVHIAGDSASSLQPGTHVVVVEIPPGRDTPYVHSSGRIYRRVGDKSDPVVETDRAQLDLLWERSRRHWKALRDRFRDLPERSQGEDDISYVHLFLLPDPQANRGLSSSITLEDFSTLMRTPTTKDAAPDAEQDLAHIELPFDNAYPSADGLIARQTGSNNPYNLVLTVRYLQDCSTQVSIPLAPALNLSRESAIQDYLSGYKHGDRFIDLCERSGMRSGYLLDLTPLYFVLTGILHKNRLLLQRDQVKEKVWVKGAVENVWRRIPFVDTDSFITQVEEHGVPLIQDNLCYVPGGTDPKRLWVLSSEGDKDPQSQHSDFASAALLLILLSSACGVSLIDLQGDDASIAKQAGAKILEHLDAARRVIERQASSSSTTGQVDRWG